MNKIIIKNAIVLPMESLKEQRLDRGFIAVDELGKIAAVGPMASMPEPEADTQVIDAQGGYLLPGLVDAHSHIGLYEDSLGFEGEDGNEDTDPITPHMRAIDGVNPMDRAFQEAREAGVTSVVVGPGSANVIGGQITALKTCGRRVDDMVICTPLAVKFALGENPKAVYHDKEEAPVTRMATAAFLREALYKAQEYAHKKEGAKADEADAPDYDAKDEALLPVLQGVIPAHFHAHRADDIFTALRIAKEFSIKPVIVHATEGHLVADLLREERVPLILGPLMTDRSKPELRNLTEEAPALLAAAGVPFAICTDHPEIPAKFLLQSTLTAVRAGLSPYTALRAVTETSAEIAGIASRVGSLTPGKDADIVLYSGDPFHYQTSVRMVLIDGAICVSE